MTNQQQPKKMKLGLRASLNIQRGFIYLFLIFLTFISLFAFYIMIVNASRAHSQIQAGFAPWFGSFFDNNFASMLADTDNNIFRATFNSLIIAFSSAILSTYFSAATAYGIHNYRFKGKKFVFVFILIIMMIPTQVSALGLVRILYQINLIDSYIPLIVPNIAAPAVFFFMKQYMASVLPYEVIESARIDGSSELSTFHRIVLPMVKPALAVQFIFAFVASWNNFFLPAVLITSPNKRTIPLLIAQLRVPSNPATFNLGMVYMMITFAVLPLIIVYFIFSRQIIKGVTLGSVKG